MARLAVLAFMACCATAGHAADPQEVLHDLPQARFPSPNSVVSGAIDGSHLDALERAGIRHVVNLRPAEENPSFDEARAVRQQGLEYHSIAIEGEQSLTLDNVQALDRILNDIGDEPALLHCSSGNRVGALIALRQAWLKGEPPDAAIQEGKRWGLTRLEPQVRSLLHK